MENFLCFQPQYVNEFFCDGSNCDAHCCKGWNIFIDKETYTRYSKLGANITAHMKPHEDNDDYLVTLDERGICPFLNENKLCRLQLEHGEDFLSLICRTYPRQNYHFGKFIERSLTLTCPLAAELILFRREPMQFELTTLPQENIAFAKLKVPEKFFDRMIDIQIAMISILQERTLSIGQRLIVLGFFLDKLEEISAGSIDDDKLTKLIAAYESKNFLAEQVPQMLASVRFNVKKFIGMMLKIFNDIFGNLNIGDNHRRLDAVIDTLKIKPDENNSVSVATVAANYEQLADTRKNFLAQYSTLLENYLVNEIFLNCYPWRFTETIANNFIVLLTTYKIFELLLFAAVQSGFDAKDDLLTLIEWFTTQTDHNGELQRRIFNHCQNHGDIFTLMESLIEQ